MKWTDQTIYKAIHDLANKLNIEVMPTTTEMRENNLTGLVKAIVENGGMKFWSVKTGLPFRIRNKKWNEETILKEILSVSKTLRIDRMPTSAELVSLNRLDLQNAISKNGGFRYWADKANLKRQLSTSNKGLDYEEHISKLLTDKGYAVELMSNGHPYDLLVNENVKVEVKVGSPHYYTKYRSHTFRPSNENPSCDIYVCVALTEKDEVEKIFIIPAKFAKVKTITVSTESKYNVFIDKWNYFKKYIQFYNSVKVEKTNTA